MMRKTKHFETVNTNDNKIAFCGSFDPIHRGHLNLIKRALKKYNFIYLIVSQNPNKKQHNWLKLGGEINDYLVQHHIKREKFKIILNKYKLTPNLMKELNTNIILRGYRNKKDYEYEIDLINSFKKYNQDLEFVLLKSRWWLRNERSSNYKK